MRRLLTHFWNDEHGMIVTAEMVVIGTVGVLATIVGVDLLATSVTLELNDLSNAFLKLNQSYSYTGFRATGGGRGGGTNSRVSFPVLLTEIRSRARI
jgi:Flp pilus assembly pilin Flp